MPPKPVTEQDLRKMWDAGDPPKMTADELRSVWAEPPADAAPARSPNTPRTLTTTGMTNAGLAASSTARSVALQSGATPEQALDAAQRAGETARVIGPEADSEEVRETLASTDPLDRALGRRVVSAPMVEPANRDAEYREMVDTVDLQRAFAGETPEPVSLGENQRVWMDRGKALATRQLAGMATGGLAPMVDYARRAMGEESWFAGAPETPSEVGELLTDYGSDRGVQRLAGMATTLLEPSMLPTAWRAAGGETIEGGGKDLARAAIGAVSKTPLPAVASAIRESTGMDEGQTALMWDDANPREAFDQAAEGFYAGEGRDAIDAMPYRDLPARLRGADIDVERFKRAAESDDSLASIRGLNSDTATEAAIMQLPTSVVNQYAPGALPTDDEIADTVKRRHRAKDWGGADLWADLEPLMAAGLMRPIDNGKDAMYVPSRWQEVFRYMGVLWAATVVEPDVHPFQLMAPGWSPDPVEPGDTSLLAKARAIRVPTVRGSETAIASGAFNDWLEAAGLRGGESYPDLARPESTWYSRTLADFAMPDYGMRGWADVGERAGMDPNSAAAKTLGTADVLSQFVLPAEALVTAPLGAALRGGAIARASRRGLMELGVPARESTRVALKTFVSSDPLAMIGQSIKDELETQIRSGRFNPDDVTPTARRQLKDTFQSIGVKDADATTDLLLDQLRDRRARILDVNGEMNVLGGPQTRALRESTAYRDVRRDMESLTSSGKTRMSPADVDANMRYQEAMALNAWDNNEVKTPEEWFERQMWQVGEGEEALPAGTLFQTEPVTVSADDVLAELRQTQFIPTNRLLEILGDTRPEYLDNVAAFVLEQREKVRTGTLTVRDVAKAYLPTVASQRAGAIDAGLVEAVIGPLDERFTVTGKKGNRQVRPEEAMAAWMFTPDGQRALDALDAGTFDAEAWETVAALRDVYGNNTLRNSNVFGPSRDGAVSMQNLQSVVDDINAAKGDIHKVEKAVRKLKGVGNAKTPFISHLLGFGENPTMDAVEFNGWLTGKADVGKLRTRQANLARQLKAKQDVDRVAGAMSTRALERFKKLRASGTPGTDLPDEVFGAIMHHWFWDRLKGTETTHAGMYDAMRRASESDGVTRGTIEQAARGRAAQEASPEFAAFFEGSKVVDADGKPLVVYHGTDSDFTEFRDGPTYFSPDRQYPYLRQANAVVPAYVSLKNPLYTSDTRLVMDLRTKPDVVQDLKNQGYDGIVYADPANLTKPSKSGNAPEIVSFYPSQVKSAVGNVGTFDPANPNILYSVEGGKVAGSIEPMPESAEALPDGTMFSATKPRTATLFSGGGLVEEGLRGLIEPTFAVEANEAIGAAYKVAHGDHVKIADVRTVSVPGEGEIDYLHASPVCKDFSRAKTITADGEQPIDIETATATAEAINKSKPPVFTLENVPGYANSQAMKLIEDALTRNGYAWDARVYDSADYGAPTTRKRLLLRAVKDRPLPPPPTPTGRTGDWYKSVADIAEGLPPSAIPDWMAQRLDAAGVNWKNPDQPIIVMGGSVSKSVPYAYAGGPAPTIKATPQEAHRIILPGGEVKRVTPRAMARITGLPDSFPLPSDRAVATTLIGNGVPPALSREVFGPLLKDDDVLYSVEGGKVAGSIQPVATGTRASVEATPEFKRWFGDSKVVGADGKPLVVYHGATRDFDSFNSGGEQVGNAVFFAPDPVTAGRHANAGGGRIIPAYLKVERPWDYADPKSLRAYQDHLGLTDYEIESFGSEPDVAGFKSVARGDWDAIESPEFQKFLKSQGYDGFWVQEGGERAVGVYDPTQIKSATANVGTFDPTNPNILYSIENGQVAGSIQRASTVNPQGFYSGLRRAVADMKGERFSADQLAATLGRWDVRERVQMPDVKGPNGKMVPGEVRDGKVLASFPANQKARAEEAARKAGGGIAFQSNIGVKADEIEWTRLDSFLADNPKPTKAEVLDWLDENAVVVEERVLAGEGSQSIGEGPFATQEEAQDFMDAEVGVPASIVERDGVWYIETPGKTQYESYQLPGGKNYREVLFKTPEWENSREFQRLLSERDLAEEAWLDETAGARDQYGPIQSYSEEARALPSYARFKAARDALDAQVRGYKAPHFGKEGKNLLAHTRLADHTGPNGERLLHVEEVQSDWHQAGRDKGYRGQKEAEFERLIAERDALPEDARGPVQERINALGSGPTGVPDAPFAKTWHELVMKRILRMAAEDGYDGVTWTTGAQQVKRYEDATRQAVDEILYVRGSNEVTQRVKAAKAAKEDAQAAYDAVAANAGSGAPVDGLTAAAERLGTAKDELSAAQKIANTMPGEGQIEIVGMKNGRETYRDTMAPDKVADVLGKGMAAKIVNDPAPSGTLAGDDLTIGGEGMKGFYDQMLRSWADKYGKKWGAKSGTTTIQTEGVANEAEWMPRRDSAAFETFDRQTWAELEPFERDIVDSNLNIKKSPTATPVHYLPIPDNMRQSIMNEGQPLFSRTDGVTRGAISPDGTRGTGTAPNPARAEWEARGRAAADRVAELERAAPAEIPNPEWTKWDAERQAPDELTTLQQRKGALQQNPRPDDPEWATELEDVNDRIVELSKTATQTEGVPAALIAAGPSTTAVQKYAGIGYNRASILVDEVKAGRMTWEQALTTARREGPFASPTRARTAPEPARTIPAPPSPELAAARAELEALRGQRVPRTVPGPGLTKWLIRLFQTGDFSTALHEGGHLMALMRPAWEAKAAKVFDSAGGRLTIAGHEALAEAMARIGRGVFRPGRLKDRLAMDVLDVIGDLWGRVRDLPIVEKLPDRLRRAADRLPKPITLEQRKLLDNTFRPSERSLPAAVKIVDERQGRQLPPRVTVTGTAEGDNAAGPVQRAGKARYATDVDRNAAELRQALGLKAGEQEVDPITLLAEAMAYIGTERVRRQWGVGSLMTLPSGRTAVPKERHETVLAEAERHRRATLGFTPGPELVFNADQQAGLRRLLGEINDSPLGEFLPERLRDVTSTGSDGITLATLTPDEWNAIVGTHTDLYAGRGAFREKRAELASQSGAARLLDNVVDSAMRTDLKPTIDAAMRAFNSTMVADETLQPAQREMFKVMVRDLAGTDAEVRRAVLAVGRDLRQGKKDFRAPDLIAKVAQAIPPEVVPVSALDDLAALEGLLVNPSLNKTAPLVDDIHKFFVEAPLWATANEQSARELEALGILARADLDDPRTADAMAIVHEGLRRRQESVISTGRDIALHFAGTDEATIASSIRNVAERNRMYRKQYRLWYEGRWDENLKDIGDQGRAVAGQKYDQGDAALGVLLRLAVRRKLGEFARRMAESGIAGDVMDVAKGGAAYNQPYTIGGYANRSSPLVQQYIDNVAGYISAESGWQTTGRLEEGGTPYGAAPVNRVGLDMYGANFDPIAYAEARRQMSRWGFEPGQNTAAWSQIDLPGGGKIIAPDVFMDNLRAAMDEVAPTSMGYGARLSGDPRLGEITKGAASVNKPGPGTEAVNFAIRSLSRTAGFSFGMLKKGMLTGIGPLIRPSYYIGNILGGFNALHQSLGVRGMLRVGTAPLRTGPDGKLIRSVIKRLYQDVAGNPGPSVGFFTRDGRYITDTMVADSVTRRGISSSLASTEFKSSLIADIKAEEPTTWNNINRKMIPGTKAWAKMLDDGATAVDNYFRIGTYVDGLKRGISEEAAARLAREVAFDYNDLTDFERKVARKAILFYTFQRRNQDLFWRTLLNNPERLAAEIRLLSGMQRENLGEDSELYVSPFDEGRMVAMFREPLEDGHLENAQRGAMTLLPAMNVGSQVGLWVDLLGALSSAVTDAEYDAPSMAGLFGILDPRIQTAIAMAGTDPETGRPLADTRKKIPDNIVAADQMISGMFADMDDEISGGMLVRDIFGARPVQPWDDTEAAVPGANVWEVDRTNPGAVRAWYAFQNLVALTPMANTAQQIDRFVPGGLSDPRVGVTEGEEFAGWLGARTAPVQRREVVLGRDIRAREAELTRQEKEMAERSVVSGRGR